MDGDDFFRGMKMATSGLVAGAERASLAVGLGSLGLGGVMLLFGIHIAMGQYIVGLGTFFVCAKIGKLIEGKLDKGRPQLGSGQNLPRLGPGEAPLMLEADTAKKKRLPSRRVPRGNGGTRDDQKTG